MHADTTYILTVIAAVGVLSFLLRALPFLLFAGANGHIPATVRYVGTVLSPAAIAMLCVYCISGNLNDCGWTSPSQVAAWAGAFATVVLHLWRGNPLISILSGTVIYMILLRICA